MDRATGSWINFMNAGDTFCDNEVIKIYLDIMIYLIIVSFMGIVMSQN